MRFMKCSWGVRHGQVINDRVLNSWALDATATFHIGTTLEEFCALTPSSNDNKRDLLKSRMNRDTADNLKKWISLLVIRNTYGKLSNTEKKSLQKVFIHLSIDSIVNKKIAFTSEGFWQICHTSTREQIKGPYTAHVNLNLNEG